jgi:glucose/arabinose dehydrogenase
MHAPEEGPILPAMRIRAVAVCVALGSGILVFGGTAIAAPPSTPVITEPATEGQVDSPADVHMEAGGFSDPDPGGTLQCTDWEIQVAATSEPIWQAPCKTGVLSGHVHLGDGSFVGSYAGRSDLHYDTGYTLRVRFKDSGNEYGGYATRGFRTAVQGPAGISSDVPWALRQPGYVVEKVAGGLQLPVDIAFVPNPGLSANSPLFYVTELYGKIKVVTRDGKVSDYVTGLLNFDPNGQFPGSGELGVAGVVVDPLSGDLFADMVYDGQNGNFYDKVVRFHSDDGGHTADFQTTILDMAPNGTGPSHQVSNLTIGPDGKLYVHVGDGEIVPTPAQNLNSYLGKILRINLDGSAPNDNPLYDASDGITARDRIIAYGFRNPFGGAWRASNGDHYEVENGPSRNDRLARIDFPPLTALNFGWDGTAASMLNMALYTWSPPHAPVNIAFTQPETFGGSGFPADKMDHAFVTESGPTYASGPQDQGKRIVEFAPDAGGELGDVPAQPLVEYSGVGKATAVGLAAGPDGLYFTDLYKDDGTSGSQTGANVWRIRYAPQAPAGAQAAQAPTASVPFDLKAAIRRCRKKFGADQLKKRKRCIRKARKTALR